MSDQRDPTEEPRFRDTLDDAGKAWLDELIAWFNAGGYTEAVNAFLADEAAIERELAERNGTT